MTMNATPPRLRPLALAAVTLAALALTACAGDGSASGAGDSAPAGASAPSVASAPAPAPASAAAGFDVELFCERAAPMMVVVPREFVGSDEHVQLFTALSEVAPEDLVELVEGLEDFYRTSVSPLNPESQNWVNFPSAVQADIDTLLDRYRATC